MSQLKTNSYYKNLTANELYTGTPQIINEEYNTLKVSIQTDEQGTLTVYHSIDALSWSHYGDVFPIASDNHKQVTLKGKYVYVSYLNGADATTNFNLVSYLSKAIHNNIDVKLTTEDEVTIVPVGGAMDVNVINSVVIDGMTFTDGALVVTGGGGGGGGDASASNQEEQITLAETLNEKVVKCDTDNISGMISVDNMVDVSELATETTLLQIKTELTTNMPTKAIQEQIGEEVYTIREQQTPLQHEEAYVDLLVEGPTMWADSNPAFTTHPSQKGWYYTNSTPSSASNIYFYANTQAKQTQYTISQVMNSYAVVKIADLTATTSLPFLVVYSRPTGSGDHVPGFYKSSWIYTMPNTTQLSQIGNEFLLYWGELPNPKIHPNIRRVQATLALTRGPALQTETLQFLTINTDSAATVNTVDVIYSYLGYTTYGGLVHDIELGYGNQDTTRQVTSKLSNLSLESTQQDIKSQLSTILGVLGDSVPVVNYGLLNDLPTYIPIRANVNGEMSVNVANFPATQAVSIADTVPVSIATLPSIEVNNMISGFATETTLQDIKDKTELFTFSSKDGLNALLVKVDNQLTMPFTVTETNPLTDYATETTSALIKTQTDKLAFSTTEIDGDALNVRMYAHDVALDEIRAVRMGESSGLMIENAPGTSIAVTIADTVPISSGSPLDVHIYGSTDGTPGNWHHIKTNPNGVVSTNAIMETDNGALTSTSISGTENYNALHVLTKGTTTVSGTVKTQAQDTNNIQVANNASVVGPMRIGTLDADTQNYLWVSAIFSFTSVSSGGQVYLEVSHDASFWARPSSASTFVMSSGATVTGAIILSTPCPFRYARLWVDSGFNGSGCSAWIVMK